MKPYFAILLLLCFVSCQPAKPLESPKPVDGLLPEISRFLSEHQEFGIAIKAEPISDWEKGKSQLVSFDSGKKLLFYLKDDKVSAVYEHGEFGRVKVWGKSE
jgi:hypothetical protein